MARELISRKKDARLVNINVTFPFEFELISSWMEFLEGRETRSFKKFVGRAINVG